MSSQHSMNPVWLAQSRLRRRKFDECLEICNPILDRNPYDQASLSLDVRASQHRFSCAQAVWYLKCRCLTLKNWIDDTEIEEEVRWIRANWHCHACACKDVNMLPCC